MTTTTATASDCVRAVEGIFHPLLASLRASGDAIAPLFDRDAVSSDEVLKASRPHALEILQVHRAVGAGFVVAPGVLADASHLLAWWQGDDRERIPDSAALVNSADYSHQEWFRTPLRTSGSHVTGPYIDYVCTDELVVTTTVGVARGSRPVGVMGADVLAETLEHSLGRVFGDARATLVNHHDRVAVSGDARIFAGESVDRADYTQALPCAGLPFTVLA